MLEVFSPDGRGDERFGYMCDASQLGPLFGFNELVPQTGPTTCQLVSDSFADDGGCYSSFKAVASRKIANLFTTGVGSKSEADCQNFCIEGKFNSEGIERLSSPCFSCNAGNYSSQKAQTQCSVCAPGSYTKPSGSWKECSPCERGKFTPLHGASACIVCGSGKFTPFPGLSACYWCQPGSYSHVNFPDSCPECPPSSFSNASGVTDCESCGDGTYTSGFGFSACTMCGPGSYLVQPLANTNNTNNNTNSTSASQVEARASECLVCSGGTYSGRPSASTFCLPCAAGSFSLSRQSHCELCPAGTFSGNASSMCHDCLPGAFSSVGQSACTACAPGSFSGQRQVVCDLCVSGRYEDAYNPTACPVWIATHLTLVLRVDADSCDTHGCTRYQDADNASTCLSCQKGTYSGSRGMSTCVLCEYAKYSIHDQTTACTQCPPQHNTTGRGIMSPDACIKHCPPGEAGFNGVYPCTTCAPGRYAPTYGTLCVEFQVLLSALWTGSGIREEYYVLNGTCVPNSCPLCEPGKHASNYNQSACELCELHTYSNYGQAQCTACVFGSETLQKGSQSPDACLSFCAKGTSSVTTQYPCYACAPGKYQDQAAQTSCRECPKQSYMPRFYAPSCMQCPDGKGTLSTGAIHLSDCVGWAEKFLNPDFCNSTHGRLFSKTAATSYLRDEGALRQQDLEVVRNGSRLVDGILVFDTLGSSGQGAVALFKVSGLHASLASISVVEGGHAYTSTGAVTAHLASLEHPLLPAMPQMGSVVALNVLPFVSLQATPETLMSGCIAGSITVPRARGNLVEEHKDTEDEMVAHYTADGAGAFASVCFGEVEGNVSSTGCRRNLNNHGQNYQQDPVLLVQERGIRAIKVRAGSMTHGCKVSADLRAANRAAISRFFRGSYTVNDQGSILSGLVSQQDVAVAHEYGAWSVFPIDPACACGTGVEALSLGNQSGLGFLPEASGVVFVVPNLVAKTSEYGDIFIPGVGRGQGSGGGFEGSFLTDRFGRVSSVTVMRAGQGYEHNVSVALCPLGTSWNTSEACCHVGLPSDTLKLPKELQAIATSYIPSTGCFLLHQPHVHVQIGKVGGVAGPACFSIAAL